MKYRLDPAKFDEVRVKGNAITYSVIKPSIVRVLIRPRGRRFAVVRTLVDWEYRKPGEYTEVWDGKSDEGEILDPELFDITVQTQPPRGAVNIDKMEPYVAPDDYELEEKTGHGIVLIDGKPQWIHSVHHHGKCSKLDVKITNISPVENNGDGLYTVYVDIGKDGGKRGYGEEAGHSVRFYVNNYLLHEDKTIRGDKAEWILDVSQIPEGEHILTVAVCDHHDHHGTDSVKIRVTK
jgi:hypothetical protein